MMIEGTVPACLTEDLQQHHRHHRQTEPGPAVGPLALRLHRLRITSNHSLAKRAAQIAGNVCAALAFP